MNWLIIIMMLVIAGMFGHFTLELFGYHPASGNAADFSQYRDNDKPTPATVA